MRRLFTFGEPPTAPLPADLSDAPDWVQANPRKIDRALERALARPAGGWYAIDDRRAIGRSPRAYTVAGEALILWRTPTGRLRAAPEACPHMGASLACAKTRGDNVVCPWHGLELGDGARGTWRERQAHDDGVVAWVRLDDGEAATDSPVLAPRPRSFLSGVIRMEARCEPADILANRLDPWHGAHYHPHSFARLAVLSDDGDVLTVRVAYRVAGPLAVEVDATFHCPDKRTIVMTIVGGEGIGSVVETHATPIGPGRCAVLEATLACSERRGFAVARRLAPLLRPMIARRAARLWVEDVEYAERRYALRQREPARLTIAGGG
jgi:isorenieratene synthase